MTTRQVERVRAASFVRNTKQSHSVGEQADRNALLFDFINLVTGTHEWNMGRWLYSDSIGPDDKVKGAELWRNFAATSLKFYMASNDVNSLHEALPDLAKKIRPGFSLIDLGPGSAEAFTAKSMELVKGLRPASHYIIDGASEFRETARDQLTLSIADGTIAGLENIVTRGLDFFKPMGLIETDPSKPCLVYIGGGTIANLPVGSENGQFPRQAYVDYFKQLHAVGQGGVSLLVPFDTNQNRTSLLKSYSEPTYAAWVENLPYRLARDLNIEPPEGLVPNAYRYQQIWESGSHRIGHTLVVQKEQEFKVGTAQVHLIPGDRLNLNPSYKIPAKLMKEIGEEAGWVVGGEYPVARGKYTSVLFQQKHMR